MILVVDSGSTTTEWVFVNEDEITRIKTPGFNPYYFKNEEYLDQLVNEDLGEIRFSKVEEVFFYGSGCSSAENCTLVKSALWQIFTNATVHVGHDLLAAAIALCGNNEGIACIMGTGSNSCLWNGKEIIENVPSLGYLLADEGSGVYLGKTILREILYGNAPKEISEAFYEEYKTNFSTSLDKLYKEEKPNKFMASISRFAYKHTDNKWIREMIKANFQNFIDLQISKYTNSKNYKVNFIGSVAFVYSDILKLVLEENGYSCGKIIRSPIDELVRFHLS